jgi:two-component system alkaline phosphatase synthesis response regulator PhoP
MNKSILIVDDEPDIREFLGYFLKKNGFNIYYASNGQEACDIALEVIPDVILLDLMMPVMNGFEASRNIRANDKLNSTFIIVLSALTETLAITAGHHIFFNDYIKKPARPSIILNRINTLLNPE